MANNLINPLSSLTRRLEYNPDVLNCIVNLSSDEVFTPPVLVNQMLDMLPQELFKSDKTTFCDPFTKSGVFLREIVKRLIEGQAPNYQLRVKEIEQKTRQTDEDKAYMDALHRKVEHILGRQVFGIATTELTALLSRRSVYCSKTANGEHSVVRFNTPDGNVHYTAIKHTWSGGKCKFCGASQAVYDRGDQAEQYAYEFIHTQHPEKFFKDMKFDVIIGNPPYQLSDGGNAASAKPLYHLFVEQAEKLNPRYLCMIIPARWYAGGKGLDSFRDSMLKDGHISYLADFPNSADCFAGVNIAGGICYFLWERDKKNQKCKVENFKDGHSLSVAERSLAEYPYFVRDNFAINIIGKIKKLGEKTIDSMVHSRNSFTLPSNERGHQNKGSNDLKMLSSEGSAYISKNSISDRDGILDKHKVIITYAMSGGNKPSSEGNYQIISSLLTLPPKEVCTETYLVIGAFDTAKEAQNLQSYVKTKFFRFLLLQALSSIHITKSTFMFVPLQDFSQSWDDEKLYAKYELNNAEIDFIESIIKPVE